ncbi:DUF445 domain-containing protein [Corynebacterium guangdongense]|uniref:Uncharacterized membrane-anchored protein YjiN (DUF445 family) n=1 Tax=Corynebacterium guangdongense TaxID=1783348 RepID=A0ABU2A107_9CORY|nr:DUF445 family protein [Corynebacterium guangdongense]MDR7330871.1 uncharacterized membrane-anchored protein YjiN (DUF445 family) [Corynebacterium guangdongense]WJZ16886.1 hypothetical protein CGUA_01430 [Corynebacterium guangdongense]
MGKHTRPDNDDTAPAVRGTVPGPDPLVEAERRRVLRRYQAFATGLLVVAAIIFLTCSFLQSRGYDSGWLGLVRAGAEAGMVGGIADWFAVTALFRHPLGIPIPHTALLPRQKDKLGDTLSEFVGDNFLNAQLITEKVSSANIPERIGGWMSQWDNARVVSREAGRLLAAVVRDIDPADAEAIIRSQVIGRATEPKWAPPAGRLLQGLIDDGKTEPVVQATITWARRKIDGMEESVVTMIDDRMPQWAPRFARDLVGERVYKEIVKFIEDVDRDPDHEARHAIRRFIAQLAEDLQHDEGMIERVEGLKADMMASTAVQELPGGIWASTSKALLDAAEDPASALRTKVTELTVEWGVRIRTDHGLRTSLDRRLTGAVKFLAENYSGEVTSIISETVQRWDAKEAADKIELMVGKDLQFIRFNGTIVGALAGMVIYTVNYVLFGV